MNASTAKIGELAEPLVGKIKSMFAELLVSMMPIIETLVNQFLPPVMELAEQLMPVIIDLVQKLLPPITEIITAILPIFVELIDMLLPPIVQIVQAVLPLLLQLIQPLLPLLKPILDILKPFIDVIMMILNPLIELLNMVLPPLIKIISVLIGESLKPLIDIFSNFASLFGNRVLTVINGVKDAFSALKNVFRGVLDFIKNVFKGDWAAAWESVKNIFSNIWDGIKAVFKIPINYIIDGLNFFIRALNKIKIPDWVPVVGGKGFHIDEIQKLRIGMDYVPYDNMPALLHRGERVLTAAEAKEYDSGAASGVNINIYNPNFTNESEVDRIMNKVVTRLRTAGVKA